MNMHFPRLYGGGVKVPKSLKLKVSCFLPKNEKKMKVEKSLVNVQLWWGIDLVLKVNRFDGCCVINFTWGLFFSRVLQISVIENPYQRGR